MSIGFVCAWQLCEFLQLEHGRCASHGAIPESFVVDYGDDAMYETTHQLLAVDEFSEVSFRGGVEGGSCCTNSAQAAASEVYPLR